MAIDKTTRNVILAALGLFLFLPKKSNASNYGTAGNPGNGYTPTSGNPGDLSQSYLGIAPTSRNRGIRNNNPGNIKFNRNNNWQGKVPEAQNTDAKVTDTNHPRYGQPTFEQYDSYVKGIRSLIYILKNSYISQGYDTLTKILDRYTPGHSSSYLQYLSDMVGIPPTQIIQVADEAHLKNIVQAITRFENGQTASAEPNVVTDAQYITARSIL